MLRVALLSLAIMFCINTKAQAENYVFEVEELHQIVKDSLEQRGSMQDQFSLVHSRLQDRYGKRINAEPKWIFNQTAGALGQLQILYCSTREYLIFFGSTIGTEGHSGRHEMDVWDIMLRGEMWTALQGELERNTYHAGDLAFLPQGKAKAYKIPEYGYMLEYGRGNIISALKQGVLMPAVFINQDYESMKLQLQECGKSVLASWFSKRTTD